MAGDTDGAVVFAGYVRQLAERHHHEEVGA
jgi:hypothetical protein